MFAKEQGDHRSDLFTEEERIHLERSHYSSSPRCHSHTSSQHSAVGLPILSGLSLLGVVRTRLRGQKLVGSHLHWFGGLWKGSLSTNISSLPFIRVSEIQVFFFFF